MNIKTQTPISKMKTLERVLSELLEIEQRYDAVYSDVPTPTEEDWDVGNYVSGKIRLMINNTEAELLALQLEVSGMDKPKRYCAEWVSYATYTDSQIFSTHTYKTLGEAMAIAEKASPLVDNSRWNMEWVDHPDSISGLRFSPVNPSPQMQPFFTAIVKEASRDE